MSLFPSGNGRLSLLPGTYALESQAVVLLDFIGPGAIEATGTGILDFQITSTPVPEPATWTLMLACVGALGARRMRGRNLLAHRSSTAHTSLGFERMYSLTEAKRFLAML